MKSFLMVVSNYCNPARGVYKDYTILTPYESRKQINKDSFMIGVWKLKTLKK